MSKHPGFNPRNTGMPNGAKPMPTGQPVKPGVMTVNDVFDGAQALLEGGKAFGQALSQPPTQPEQKKEPTIAAVVPVDTTPASEPTSEKIVSKSAEVISAPKEPATHATVAIEGKSPEVFDPRNIGEIYRNHSFAEMARWYIGCFDGENDAIIPTAIKFNTSRIKVGDICDINIWSPESQVGFRQATVVTVDENTIVFKAFNCVTMRDEDITISTEMLMNPGKRKISIAGQSAQIPGIRSMPYPCSPQYQYAASPPIPAF